MHNFKDFISENKDSRIIRILCKMRAKIASNRHENHLLRCMSPDVDYLNVTETELGKLLPPRKQWVTLGFENRYNLSQGHNQKKTTLDVNILRIEKTIYKFRKSKTKVDWLINLEDFILEIKQSCDNPLYKIKRPITTPISKNKKIDDKDECRPISIFGSLKDKIIISLANQYLTQLFDKYFYTESLAFRAKRNYDGKCNYNTTHHDAIDRICEYRDKNKHRRIYVSECDMQKFYDSVSHKVVRQEFGKLMRKAKKDNKEVRFDSIERIFNLYLDCYNFYNDVFKLNENASYWRSYKYKGLGNGCFEWVDKQLVESKLCKNAKGLSHMKIGIPQGGALSGLISNIVLNAADNVVLQNEGNFLYVRYCDDMILLHTNKTECVKIMKQYKVALCKLRLIPHEFCRDLPFRTKGYWKTKSKSTYMWDSISGSNWIGFVGYEINRNGDIRIRKSSLRKEIYKQTRVSREICQGLKDKKRVSTKSIVSSIQHKLISMSVGRVSLWNYSKIENELCWINGFRRLNYNKYVSLQIRNLDRCRNNRIYKTYNFLKALKGGGEIHKDSVDLSAMEYNGCPYSYYYHYIKNQIQTSLDNK